MKSHRLIHGIREINLPQIGSRLDKLEWKRVSNIVLRIFSNFDIQVNIFFQKDKKHSNFDNALLAQQYPHYEKTRIDIFHMAKARKLALEGMLKITSYN